MHINWIKKISEKNAHNAFTDLCEFKGELFCCYREAKNHVSNDGAIRIISADYQGKLTYSEKLTLENTDIRDPKLSITPEGNLLLIAYARGTDQNNKTLTSRNICWVSQTGRSWSNEKEFADRGWWLWRLTWHNKLAYGFAYNRRANAIHLYQGNPRRTLECHQKQALSLTKHGKGYPNESDLIFTHNKAYALVRRDADSYSAQLGESKFPFKKWQWTDLKIYIGGPAMLHIKANLALVVGRIVKGKKLVTGLLLLNLSSGQLKLLKVLPSAGDNSYPGLVIRDQLLYVSYYSSHESNKTNVYLAEINLKPLLKEE